MLLELGEERFRARFGLHHIALDLRFSSRVSLLIHHVKNELYFQIEARHDCSSFADNIDLEYAI